MSFVCDPTAFRCGERALLSSKDIRPFEYFKPDRWRMRYETEQGKVEADDPCLKR